MDFDPTASAPTAEELLSACVDALASLFSEILPPGDQKKVLEVVEQPLSAFENVPFAWAPMTVNKRQIHLKVDKANIDLEQMTDQWLEANDPNHNPDAEEEFDLEQAATPRAGKKPGKSDLH